MNLIFAALDGKLHELPPPSLTAESLLLRGDCGLSPLEIAAGQGNLHHINEDTRRDILLRFESQLGDTLKAAIKYSLKPKTSKHHGSNQSRDGFGAL